MIISSRSAAEYRDMFGLTPADLAVPTVLDSCCAGGSSFAAETAGRVVAADPAYALDQHDLAGRSGHPCTRAIRSSASTPGISTGAGTARAMF